MIRSPLFWKLFLAFATLNFLAGTALIQITLRWHEERTHAQINQRLHDAGVVLEQQIAERLLSQPDSNLQNFVRELGRSTELRSTVIGVDGIVVADSTQESLKSVDAMENHLQRPEFVAAIARKEAYERRESSTIGEWQLYYARRVERDGEPVGVIRISVPRSNVEQDLAQLRRLIWTTAGILAVAMGAILYIVVGRIVRPVLTLNTAAQALVRGDYRQRVFVNNRDELGELAKSVNQVSEELGSQLIRLRESGQRQSTVLGGMIEGVIAVDNRERVQFANTAAGKLFSFMPPRVEGRPLLEVARNDALHQAVAEVIESRRPKRLDIAWEGPDKLHLFVQITPLPGKPCPGAVIVVHDTTELRRLEGLRQEFMANVSHELKTPLSSIKAFAETLLNGAIEDVENARPFVARIEEQADRLHALIQDMLSLARIESAQQSFKISTIAVDPIVRACVEDHRNLAEAKSIRISILAPGEPVRVKADEEGLRVILNNLIDNAIKYTPESGAVNVEWRSEGEVASIDVTDTGIGLSREDQTRVFERFYRVDKARSRELGGTGLGLSIVKHLTQAFGGSIEVQSEPGKGSVFSVHLPTA
jgi:two-component system, OmpR family, phosphate regulon sensor histidine kinase PhoR